jgi:hypothetical protein
MHNTFRFSRISYFSAFFFFLGSKSLHSNTVVDEFYVVRYANPRYYPQCLASPAPWFRATIACSRQINCQNQPNPIVRPTKRTLAQTPANKFDRSGCRTNYPQLAVLSRSFHSAKVGSLPSFFVMNLCRGLATPSLAEPLERWQGRKAQ